jgi:ATP-binding cassette, subfamily D (ALD), peroxisomal long-chain fatty acid import protein
MAIQSRIRMPSTPASRKQLLILLAAVLITRSRLVSLPASTIAKLSVAASRKQKASKEELARAMQTVYVKEEDGSKSVLVPYQNVISKVNPSSRRIVIVFY